MNDMMRKLAALHASTYDALAEEYEKRTDVLAPVTEKAVKWMSQYLVQKGKILDLGCGVGLAASFFIKNGFDVVCLDISPKMIEYAKKRSPSANFLQEDFLTASFDYKFDGVFAFTFIHLFPKDIALKVLEKIRSILKVGGIAYIGSTKSEESGEGWEIKKDYESKHERYRKHWTEPELKAALTTSGFKIIDSKIYTDPFKKTWMDFIAKKI